MSQRFWFVALAATASLTIVNRSAKRGLALAELIRVKTGIPTTFVSWEARYQPSEVTDLLINATSIGLCSDTSRVPVARGTLPESASSLVW
jgi:shikimate 5-dehydrogenase